MKLCLIATAALTTVTPVPSIMLQQTTLVPSTTMQAITEQMTPDNTMSQPFQTNGGNLMSPAGKEGWTLAMSCAFSHRM